MKKKALVSSFVLGIIVIAVIFLVLKPEEMLEQIKRIDPKYLLVALALQILSLIIVSARWHWFINSKENRVSRKNIFLITLAGQSMNSVTPGSRWGGEPVKAYLLHKKEGIPAVSAMASIVVEKIADIIAFSLIATGAIIYGLLFLNVPQNIMILLILALFFTLSVLFALFYVSFFKRIRSETIIRLMERYKWITDKIPVLAQYKHKVESNLNNYYITILKISSKKHAWPVGVLLSLAYWGTEIGRTYVIFMALGVDVPLAVIATAHVISSLIGSFPLLPGDLGIVEGTMILIYSSISIVQETGLAVGGVVTIIDRFFSYWLVIIIGLPLTWYLGLTSMKGEKNEENGTS
mgnify:CR=1 FL=1